MQLADYAKARTKKAKPSKYRNKPVVVDGVRFASKAEAKRWMQLKALQSSGKIYGLTRQVRHRLIVNGVAVGAYVADFVYANGLGRVTVEDTKGVLTADCRIKLKLMEACYGIKVQLLTKSTHPGLFR